MILIWHKNGNENCDSHIQNTNMNLLKVTFYIYIFLIPVLLNRATAQTIEHNGWLFWSHQQKINEKWQLSSDIQIRSSDKLNYVNTLLIRPGIGYNINNNQTITIGYTYFGTWEKENDIFIYENENRIFEQFQIESKLHRIELTNRIRYEQRFIREQEDRFFAQRIRYNIQAVFPLIANSEFTKGMYTSVQNELFLNIQGKSKLNNDVFDQNRSYVGLGYRFSKKLDIEADYMFRYIVEEDTNGRNNVLQIAIKSSF